MDSSGGTRSGNSYFLPSPMLRARGQREKHVKYILVTGGVCSSLGKGVTTSSMAALLKAEGYRVCTIKIDPYINIDAGLMSPFEHGEVYVLNDGGEVDLDLGNYERWVDLTLTRDHNITTGKIFDRLIRREREGKFLGKTVQLVPHFTNEVVEHIIRVGTLPVDRTGISPQICLIELGGTIGDFESAPFVEALRTLRFTLPPEDFCIAHCTYLPVMGGGQKTKPTQHSCRTLLSLGLTPDLLVCRSEQPLAPDARRKLSQQIGLEEKYILGAHNVSSLYDVPVLFAEQNFIKRIKRKLQLSDFEVGPPPMAFPTIEDYKSFSHRLLHPNNTIRIAFVGKYVLGGTDAYFSVMTTFEHCCMSLGVRIEFYWLDSESLEKPEDQEKHFHQLEKCDGIFVPGGFGLRGSEGKIAAIRFARERQIPYLGVCFGFQLALVEIARSVLQMPDATSEELDPEKKSPNHHILKYMPEIDRGTMGANMRLGIRTVQLVSESSIMRRIYGGATAIQEKHRHRYEFNLDYLDQLKSAGVDFAAVDDPSFKEGSRVEAIELPSHPFFLAVQFHPEFITHPLDPSPPFLAFVLACCRMSLDAHPWPAKNHRTI